MTATTLVLVVSLLAGISRDHGRQRDLAALIQARRDPGCCTSCCGKGCSPAWCLASACFSADHYSLAIANSIAHNSALQPIRTLGTASIMRIAATASCLVRATVCLPGFNVKGDVA